MDDRYISEFYRIKPESRFAILELITYEYLRRKYRDSKIYSNRTIDFVIEPNEYGGKTFVEVKTHITNLMKQQALFTLSLKNRKTRLLLVVENRHNYKDDNCVRRKLDYKSKYVYFRVRKIDEFNSPIGKLYVYEVHPYRKEITCQADKLLEEIVP